MTDRLTVFHNVYKGAEGRRVAALGFYSLDDALAAHNGHPDWFGTVSITINPGGGLKCVWAKRKDQPDGE